MKDKEISRLQAKIEKIEKEAGKKAAVKKPVRKTAAKAKAATE